jgi:hypothetical protein
MLAAALVSWLGTPHAAGISVDALKARMSGVYLLEEWHSADGKVFRPPVVDGRFVVLNGSIMAIFHNRIKAPEEKTFVLFGKYTLDANTFAYQYDSTSIITETASETNVSHKPLWDGMRSFAVIADDGNLRLHADGGQEFTFNADGATYSEGGVLRVWRRLHE